MTAINTTVQGKRAYLMADRAATWGNGTIHWIDSKLIVGKSFPFALAVSGNLRAGKLAEHLNAHKPRNPRALVQALLRSIKRMDADALAEGNRSPKIAVYAAVWSARLASAAIVAVSNGQSGLPAYDPKQFGWTIGSAGQPADALGRPVDMTDPASFDVRRDGVQMMEWQRRNELFDLGDGWFHAIGGGIDLATVSRDGVEIETIHTWPDRVGLPIAP